ncbi:ORF26 [Retroperitoneal fibromatosis-associated herpesvirus]|uniref:ORF26 n=1 Tax=Retroperitoneal fibromatosis-associated herpesvirus TaxID=111469 RepID=U5NIV3_9GAMA|nr:ORF26 [Retroperitoneal fibromatosis-associated herpesvirus]AGY30709.1 ORF26 [Retroperitoneal fibromatosis-associated herpesvirus]
MALDRSIIVTLTSRLFADELAVLQSKIGSVLPVRDCHRIQSIQALGLGSVCSRETATDYIQVFKYLASCTLAVLEEVGPDSLRLTRMDSMDNVQIKNVYSPFFQWDNHTRLAVLPPVFDRRGSTVVLESNGVDLVFPMVVPESLGHVILQQLLVYHLYARVAGGAPDAVNMAEVELYTTNVTHMGRHYQLDVANVDPRNALGLLDDLSMYLCIFSALLPRVCLRLLTALVRHDRHPLVEVFEGVVPEEVTRIDIDQLNVADDITRMRVMFSYLQSLSSIFNLGARLHVYSYAEETLTASCWYAPS